MTRGTTQRSEWLQLQLRSPQAFYSMRELSLLSGQSAQRVKRHLIRRRMLEAKATREHHFITIDEIQRAWPEFWRAVRRRVSGLVEEIEEDPDQ